MNAAIIWDEAYAEHDTGSRPEGADRISTMVDHLRATDLWPGLTVVKPEAATEDDILLVHTPRHLAMIKRAGQGGDTCVSESIQVPPPCPARLIIARCRGVCTRRMSSSVAASGLTTVRPGHRSVARRWSTMVLMRSAPSGRAPVSCSA